MPEDFPLVVESDTSPDNTRSGSSLMQGTFNLVSALKTALCCYRSLLSTAWVFADKHLHGSWLTQHALRNAAQWLAGDTCVGSLDLPLLPVWQADCPCL